MVITTPELWWDASTLESARAFLTQANQETEAFVLPFLQARGWEALDGESKWTTVSIIILAYMLFNRLETKTNKKILGTRYCMWL